jgi:cell wall-associated NlpC family hydrolase
MLREDVLLVTGENKISSSLVTAKKGIYSNSVSSHVELSLGDGIFIHATNDKGVHLVFLKDELNPCNESWRVIRLKSLNENQRYEITKASFCCAEAKNAPLFTSSGLGVRHLI